MIKKVFEYSARPELYAESSSKFWDDEHISKGMLEAHINPEWDAASRNHSFIDKSVEWISEAAPSESYKRVLDLGCGPGMYTERLFKKGYSVTGVDFSKRSIEYAKQMAEEKGYNIEYIYKNYLEIDFNNEFDLILLIYCDFGALSAKQREILLTKIYKTMKPGGKFIFDVFTPKNYEGKVENNKWYINEGSGFWNCHTYMCLESYYIYENNTRLQQYVLIDKDDKVEVFRLWDHYYTKAAIIDELNKAGFYNIKIYSDASGEQYYEESKTMCIVVEK